MSATLSLRDRLANYEMLLRELQAWCRYDGFGRRAAQAAEYAQTIGCALAGEDTHILARHERLEEVAATTHQLTSEHGYPALLRELADTLEAVCSGLNESGFNEWQDIGGIEVRP